MSYQAEGKKRFFIHTLGCKVNQYDSQAMRELLVKAGFMECMAKDIADIYIINTCTVTKKADRESRHLIGVLHRANPKAKIVVTGCYVEKNSDDIAFLPGVSHILKNGEKPEIARILTGQLVTDAKLPALSITEFKGHVKAFVKIQDGCENFCSYCKVPFVRGGITSKPIKKIYEEVSALVENGFKEIVLTGVCLGAWGSDLFPNAVAESAGFNGASLVDVLKAIDKIQDSFRIRLSSIEPRHISDELLNFIAGNNRMCRHLHIPMQSGDDEILKRMNRPYTAKVYRELIDNARRVVKDIAITTDVMVGFPGETESSFKNTVGSIKELLPARTHIFTFSKRDGTAASGMGPEVEINILKRRYCVLNAVATSASYLYRRTFLSTTLNVLVEEKRERNTGMLTGYTDNYIKVLFEGGDDLMRKIVPVRIEEVNLVYTIGVMAK